MTRNFDQFCSRFLFESVNDDEYLRLAIEPEKNHEELQRMVDDAAKAAGGIDVWHKSRSKSYVPKTGKPRYEMSSEDWTVFDMEKATYGVFYASTDKKAVEGWGSTGKTKRFFIFPKNTAQAGIDVAGSSFLSDADKRSLEARGFDSVTGNGEGWGGGAPEIAIFNPSQIKSADPVTYDAAGNIIPLSQRFDSSKDDIRY
jgi:hypothetical protein